MKTKILLLCFSIAVIPFLGGCGKYEEGPAFSLSSKKGRVANTWKFEKVFIYQGNNSGFIPGAAATGTDLTSDYKDKYYEFKKDGTCIMTDGSSPILTTWLFASDKEDIVFYSDTYHIIKLKGKGNNR